jgi:hypothetical protein
MVFAPAALQRPGLELCVNFGLCKGREATPAEISGRTCWSRSAG